MFKRSGSSALLALACVAAATAWAEEPIKVGMILEMSGPFADLGRQILTGAQAYIKAHGDTVAGRKIELIVKDTTGAAPDVAKRLAQELITNDNVDFLAGFGMTPNALAVAPLATEARKPMIIMNAATSVITTRSPYIARVSMTLPQVTAPLATWAMKSGIKSVYTLVSDYGPGIDAETTFKKDLHRGRRQDRRRSSGTATQPGVRAVLAADQGRASAGGVHISARQQRAAGGVHERLRGARTQQGRHPADRHRRCHRGRRTRGNGRHAARRGHDAPLFHGPQQRAKPRLSQGIRRRGRQRCAPNFMAVGGWDGMAAIYEVVRRLNGQIDGDKAMEVLKGLKIDSPRGPLADRSRDARSDSNGVRAPRAESQRQAVQRRVRAVPGRQAIRGNSFVARPVWAPEPARDEDRIQSNAIVVRCFVSEHSRAHHERPMERSSAAG